MRSICVILFLVLSVSMGCKSDKKEDLKSDQKDVLFKELDGKSLSLNRFAGKRIVVNYWATWCTPCLQEFPSLVKAQEILSDDNYVFLFPSPDGVAEIKEFNKKRRFPLQFVSLNQPLDKLNIYALPATFIYKTDGTVYKRIDGATDWSSPEIIEMLRSVP